LSGHGHPTAEHRPERSPWAARIRAIEELLVEKGVMTREEVEAHENGARLVARAWVDPAFRELLLSDTKAAAAGIGLDASGTVEFATVENTEEEHNVVVCTLCSCYPRAILGYPPAWYKSAAYRSRAVAEPREVLREFGLVLPESTRLVVHDSSADLRYLVLPRRPEGTEGMGEEELASLVTRDSLIGTDVPRPPG
jgi:nitrile hydratase subunit alpha